LTELYALWRHHGLSRPDRQPSASLTAALSPEVLKHRGEVPVEVIQAYLSGRIRLYGVVAMEVFDQVAWVVTDPEPLFESELAAYLRELGVPYPDQSSPPALIGHDQQPTRAATRPRGRGGGRGRSQRAGGGRAAGPGRAGRGGAGGRRHHRRRRPHRAPVPCRARTRALHRGVPVRPDAARTARHAGDRPAAAP